MDQDAVTRCGGGDVAVAKVAHGSLAQRCHAAEADAHPASRRHQDSGRFAGIEQCLVARGVEDGRGLGEGDGAAITRRHDGGAKPLGVQAVGHAVVVPVLLEGVEHAGRSARPSLALGEVVDEYVEFGGAEHAVGVSVLLDQADSALACQHAQFAAEDYIVGCGGAVYDHDVVEVLGHVAQHSHHRGDTAARGEEQDLGWRRGRQGEFPCGVVELDDGADCGVSHEVVGDLATGDRLDGDRDAAVVPIGIGGQRVSAPLTHAVDVHTDADVLPGCMGAPTAARLDNQAHRIGGFRVNRHNPAAQVGT